MAKVKNENVVVDEQKLSPEDQVLLTECEAFIVDGQKAFIRTCLAIVMIDEYMLYRPHKSLHAYCAFRFDFSDTETGRYRNAGRVLLNLSGMEAEWLWAEADLWLSGKSEFKPQYSSLPANEGQCREMARIKNAAGEQDADLQQQVWAEVISRSKKGEKITAKLIKEVIDQMTGDNGGSDEEVDGAEETASPIVEKPCNAKLSIRFEEDENFDLAQPLKDAAEYFGVECSRRKNNLTFGVEADSREKLLHKLAGWAAKYDVTRIVVDFS